MNSSTKIALVITLLDAMGIGLIMPVLPTLLREFIASEDIANHFGVLLALYALMQVSLLLGLEKCLTDLVGAQCCCCH